MRNARHPMEKHVARRRLLPVAAMALAMTLLAGPALAAPDDPGARTWQGRLERRQHTQRPPQRPMPPPFESLDKDGDGLLSETEAAGIPPVQHRGFDALDRDGDGYLGRDELPHPPVQGMGPGAPRDRRQEPPPRFEELDSDGDGKLSEAEAAGIPPVAHHGFETFDQNGDGYLTRQELPPPPGRGMRHGGPRGERPGPPRFEDLDVDGDGCITREEFPAPPQHGPAPDRGPQR